MPSPPPASANRSAPPSAPPSAPQSAPPSAPQSAPQSALQSAEPVYERIKAELREPIAAGRLKPGDMLPSEAELMRRFGASRMTVNRAMRELAAEGYVERAQGRGSFVADLHRLSSTMQVRDLHEEIAARGHRHDTEVLLLRAERAAAALARRFEVPAGARLYHSVLVHYENGLPIQYEDRYVNPQAAPAYLQCDFTRETPTHHLLAVAPLTEAEVQVEARLPTTEQAARLRIGAGAPCLVVSRRTKSGARVASCATLVYPGSRYRLEGRFGA